MLEACSGNPSTLVSIVIEAGRPGGMNTVVQGRAVETGTERKKLLAF